MKKQRFIVSPDAAKWLLVFVFAMIISLSFMPAVMFLENKIPLYFEIEPLPEIELNFDFSGMPLIFIKTGITVIFSFLIRNIILPISFISVIIVLLGVLACYNYLGYRKKVFSITPYLNELLDAKRHSVHSEAAKLRKKRVEDLFKGIFRIESLKS